MYTISVQDFVFGNFFLKSSKSSKSSMAGIISAMLAGEQFLIKDMCDLIDSYCSVTDDDRIKFMFAKQEKPEVFVYETAVVEDLDEILDIKYGIENDLWSQLSVAARFESLDSRTFYISVTLPEIGSVKTQYSLFSLMSDMQKTQGTKYFENSTFVWRSVFNKFNTLGAKLNVLWDISDEEKRMIEAYDMEQEKNSREVNDAYFECMRATLGILLSGFLAAKNE